MPFAAVVLFVFQRLAQNTSGHLSAKQFQDLFDVLDKVTRPRHRPAMSYVQHPLLRKIQILVSSKCFDYVGDFMAAVNVLLVSVSNLLLALSIKDSYYQNSLKFFDTSA